jgi:putative transposase
MRPGGGSCGTPHGPLALVLHGYPSFSRSLKEDLDSLVLHLRFPSEHRKRIRSTNLFERTFVEVWRRTKVIGRFPGETSARCLIWAVLELASHRWRGITMTPKGVAEIERLRRALAAGEPFPGLRGEARAA